MRRHSIVARMNAADTATVKVEQQDSHVTTLWFVDGDRRLAYGLGQILEQLATRGIYPQETAVDLAILAATVTAADTKIPRDEDSQDSWTREIDLYLPVADPDLWTKNCGLIERTLRFLTGDIWRVFFRNRQEGMDTLIDRAPELVRSTFDSVCLFSGGLDSFVGAIDLLEESRQPIFVSQYKDASTKSQKLCARLLGAVYGDLSPRHVRANVSFDKNDAPDLGTETTTRGRSFMFFALAALAGSGLDGVTPIYIPENGLISLNIPLDPLRLGAWSTRTTHPFYMARWQELLDNLGVAVRLDNPYRFNTKGEMLENSNNRTFLQKNFAITISCSSLSKSRWQKRALAHCGYCTPCLIRRSAVHKAFGKDLTTYNLADLSARPLNAKQAESREVRSFQMMSRRLSRLPDLADVLVHKTGPLDDYSPTEISAYSNVFRRGIAEVGQIVDLVVIQSP